MVNKWGNIDTSYKNRALWYLWLWVTTLVTSHPFALLFPSIVLTYINWWAHICMWVWKAFQAFPNWFVPSPCGDSSSFWLVAVDRISMEITRVPPHSCMLYTCVVCVLYRALLHDLEHLNCGYYFKLLNCIVISFFFSFGYLQDHLTCSPGHK